MKDYVFNLKFGVWWFGLSIVASV